MQFPPLRWREIELLPWSMTVALVFVMSHPPCASAVPVIDLVAAPDPPTIGASNLTVPRILSLPEARELARRHAPSLIAASWTATAGDGRVADAGRRENPLLGATWENWGGSLPAGIGEWTLDVTQSFELGGDRGARRGVALGERSIARAEWWSEARALDAYVSESFLDAWMARERMGNARETRALAMELLVTANDRLKAGAAPAVERARAEANLALRSTEVRGAESAWGIARRRLALGFGEADAEIDSLVLPKPSLTVPAPFDSLIPQLAQHPDLLRARAAASAAAFRVRAAQASRIPDLAVRFGARRLSEREGTGYVAGVGVPLPFWNCGLGTLSAAEADRSGADVRVRAAQIRLGAELRSAHERLTASAAIWQEITQQVLPSVEAAFEALRSAYRLGRIGYVDVLDGQRAAIEARLLALDAARDAWSARLELERLTDISARGPREQEGR